MTTGRKFRLTVVSFNLGRHYPPGMFRREVLRILDHTDGTEHVALLPQELDEEPDPVREHRQLAAELEPGTRRVYWHTREPILLSPGFDVLRRRRVQTMGSGLAIGGPRGTGPARHAVTCVVRERRTRIRLVLGNTHPHRRGVSRVVDEAQDEGLEVFRVELLKGRASYGGTSGAWGADLNRHRVPKLVPGEQVAQHDGLDHLRYWQHPNGARLTLLKSGVLEGMLDPHDYPWAKFLVEAPDGGDR